VTEPKLLELMRADIGLAERVGPGSNPRIMEKVKRVAAAHRSLAWIAAFYEDDDIPWCGLQMADIVVRAGLVPITPNPLSARAWAGWGEDAVRPLLGSIAVLTRWGGGHVGVVAGVNKAGTRVSLVGGNQGNAVSQAWFDAQRVLSYRKPIGATLQPAPVLDGAGRLSTNEA
jgi:uncharacterized protein (TIGR02594 family)